MTAARPIRPLDRPVDASVSVPGSKSHTNRALACAALAAGRSVLRGALVSDDTAAMRHAVEQLGATVTSPDGGLTLVVDGTAGAPARRAATVDCRLSGTTARFTLGLAGAGRAPVTVDGRAPLRARPMGPGLAALRDLGVRVDEPGEAGHLPVTVTGPADACEVVADGSMSSQFTSGLLLAGPALASGLDLTLAGEVVSWPYLDLTVAVLNDFGVTVERPEPRRFVVAPTAFAGADVAIEPDASTASYFLAAAAVTGGEVRIRGLGVRSRQGDLAFVDVLEAMGATVERGPDAIVLRGPARLRGIEVDMADISDTAQTLAAIAPLADGPTRVTGIGFIRGKETDRIRAVVTELARCGIDATELDDGFVIVPGPIRPATIRTYDDHRMAMSFAVLGLAVPGIEIADPDCVDKTFPGFWEALDRLR